MAPWLSPAAPKRVSGELRVSDGAETASSVAGAYCLITPDALLTRWYPANFLRWGNRIFTADFRGAKSTHIPHRQPRCFSRNVDAFCEVIFHPIGPRATPLLRGHHLIRAFRGLPELPGRCVQWLSAMPSGNREN